MAAAFDHVKNTWHASFKARRLNTLIKDHVPTEANPLTDYSKPKLIINEIQLHELLSECEIVDDKDVKSVQKWTRAVDLWQERLIDLVSSSSDVNCWFGVGLLGFTAQKISLKRFEASYALWLQKLLPLAQIQASSDLVKGALWVTLSDVLTRLATGEFPDGKRDGVSFAGKLAQPLLNLLCKTNSLNTLAGVTHVLCTVLTFFHTSFNRHYDAFEASIVNNLYVEKDDEKLVILAQCLAELPKSKGEEISWCLLLKKILISVNLHLKHVFQGLEEESICDKAIRRLVPTGTDHPPPLGGHKVSPDASESASKYLLLSCVKLLSSSYPVPVTVPVESILDLIERVLMVDGSVAKSTHLFTTVMQQESACAQLPTFHEHCLDLLTALITVLGSELLLHAVKIERLLREYFSRCTLPRLRVRAYSTLQILLKSMSSGLLRHVRKYVIKTAFNDLQPFASSLKNLLSNVSGITSKESILVPCNRKRKHSVATESLDLQHGVILKAHAIPEASSLSVMIAALEVLNTVLLEDCSLDDNLRSQVDNLLIAVANAACKRKGWVKESNNTNAPKIHSSSWADFQVASLKALQISFLSSTHVRPPHLAEGLELFRRGALQTGTKIAVVCTNALASLEVLIHPRARSVADYAALCNSYTANGNSAYPKYNTMGMVSDEIDAEDSLLRTWLENEYEADLPITNSNKIEDVVKQPLQNSKHFQVEIFTSKSDDDAKSSADTAQVLTTVILPTEKLTQTTDEVMIEHNQPHKPVSLEGPTSPVATSTDTSQIASQPSNNDTSCSQPGNKNTLHGTRELFTTNAATLSATTSTMVELFKSDNTEDMDSFPDIIDADPDSDSE